MTKSYFHELDDAQRQAVYAKKLTAQQAVDTYAQPDWCSYPDALAGVMGCWSLVSGLIKSEERCQNCDCYVRRDRG